MGRAGKDKVGQFDAVGGFVFDRSAWWYLVDFPIMIFHIVLDGIWWCLGVFWLYLVASGKNRNKKGRIGGIISIFLTKTSMHICTAVQQQYQGI